MPDDMTKTAPPPMGHNSGEPPPLLDADTLMTEVKLRHGHLATRSTELLDAINDWLGKNTDANGRAIIADDDMQRRAVDLLGLQVKPHTDAIETTRTTVKAPIIAAGRAVDAYFNGTLAKDLTDAAAKVRTAVAAYANRKAQEEAERQRKEAERFAQEAARAADAARQANSSAAMETALDLEQQAIDAQRRASAPNAGKEAARVTGDFGGGAHMAGRWVARVIDPKKVPRRLCAPDMALINAEMRANTTKDGRCTASVSGVEFTYERNVRIR